MEVPATIKEITEYALRLEKDGIAFYQERATVSGDPYEKSLFESLSKDERKHIAALESVFRLGGVEAPAKLLAQLRAEDPKKAIRTIFADAREEKGKREAASGDALKPFDVALEIEKKGYNFYKEASRKVDSKDMKALLDALARMESTHIEVVTQSRLYLEKPERWFFENEPWILD